MPESISAVAARRRSLRLRLVSSSLNFEQRLTAPVTSGKMYGGERNGTKQREMDKAALD